MIYEQLKKITDANGYDFILINNKIILKKNLENDLQKPFEEKKRYFITKGFKSIYDQGLEETILFSALFVVQTNFENESIFQDAYLNTIVHLKEEAYQKIIIPLFNNCNNTNLNINKIEVEEVANVETENLTGVFLLFDLTVIG